MIDESDRLFALRQVEESGTELRQFVTRSEYPSARWPHSGNRARHDFDALAHVLSYGTPISDAARFAGISLEGVREVLFGEAMPA